MIGQHILMAHYYRWHLIIYKIFRLCYTHQSGKKPHQLIGYAMEYNFLATASIQNDVMEAHSVYVRHLQINQFAVVRHAV